jgi:transcription elongation GreA/GreB family factor
MANTPSTLVSNARLTRSGPLPVTTKPLLSSATPEPLSQSVFGSAPINRNRWRTGRSESSPDAPRQRTAETASETLLPDHPISRHPNLVTVAGLKALEFQLHQAREAHQTARMIEDVNERRRPAASPLRDVRYFAARVRTAQVITDPMSADTVAFGSTVTFRCDDGRVQKYRIVGEDEADPKSGSISFVSPVARLLMGKAVGDVAGISHQGLEIISIS